MNLSATQWKTIRGVIAAVCVFTLTTQNDLTVPSLVKYILGVVLVVLAVLDSPAQTTDPAGG